MRVMPTDWKPTEQYLRAQNRMLGRIMAVLGVVFVGVAAILWHHYGNAAGIIGIIVLVAVLSARFRHIRQESR